MSFMHLEVVTVERTVVSANVSAVTATTVEGQISVLPGHLPLVALLQPGELRVRRDREESLLFVSGGFLQVAGDDVVVLADACEYAGEIDIQRAEAARQRAEDLLKAGAYEIDAAAAEAALRRSLARLRVADHRRRAAADNLPRFSV
jgi:F-type H+-transporting ATPase subunit epsilon